ncbi:hypothetical protein BGZ98_007918 [Dissophora globulifera]|nr:hypothetical protein BGZ98_007918 [Dissophora globulifera]
MSSHDLAIETSSVARQDEADASQSMPLSPASVRSYGKKKAQKSKKTAKSEQPFSEEESEVDDDDDEASYESDKDDTEDDDTFAHLDPKFEALDGTTKIKSEKGKKDKKGQEDDDDDQDSSEEDDEDEDVDSVDSKTLHGAVHDMSLADGRVVNLDTVNSSLTDAATALSSATTPGIAINGGELYQDPTSSGARSGLVVSPQEERLQEPVKPHIALPCLVETAKNPARTRITLKYAGNEHAIQKGTKEDQQHKVSTRGRKNYMVATDLSGESWHATEWAITTILRNGDELNVVTIVEDEKGDNKAVKKGVQAEMREDAEKLTKNLHEQLEHTSLLDIKVVIHIIAATKAMGAKELLIEMASRRIDDLDDLSTVIVGSRGRGAIKGLLLGSISNFLVHNSSVPVMVVRAPKKSKAKKKARRGRFMDQQTRSVKEANLKYERAFGDDDF